MNLGSSIRQEKNARAAIELTMSSYKPLDQTANFRLNQRVHYQDDTQLTLVGMFSKEFSEAMIKEILVNIVGKHNANKVIV